MKKKPIITAMLGLLLLMAAVVPLHAQNNTWIRGQSGKWEAGSNWLSGPPQSGQYIYITNANTKTATIDATTSGSFSNTMSIHFLQISGGSTSSSNILQLTNAGTAIPLQISNGLLIGVGSSSGPGYIDIANSAFQLGFTTEIHWGGITLDSGTLIGTNSDIVVGFTSNSASLTVNGGTAQFHSVQLSGLSPATNGTCTLNGGTLSTISNFYVGSSGPGTLNVNGGMLFVTNLQSQLSLGAALGANGAASIANGEIHAYDTYVGHLNSGTFNISGGLMTVADSFIIGVSNGSSGSVVMTGGTLAVTNPTHNAVLDIRRGSLTLNGGLLQVDSLLQTNGGIFTNLSGTLQYTGSFSVDNGSSVT
ncbi:MAG TPA: hypothetical protein VFC07_08375, partial [Verrucomicrobiae bacterium]|nr:hypothetical protein [Verrucomicrobiae bacterium]